MLALRVVVSIVATAVSFYVVYGKHPYTRRSEIAFVLSWLMYCIVFGLV